MVVKPAPKTPLTALLLGEVLLAAGMPAGQVNIVPCANEDAGHLVGDPRVAMVSFTGSPAVGWRIKERCGRQKITLELGGNAAVVVHEDADLADAVPAIARGGFAYSGQSCISVQRVLVHQSVYGSFRSQLLSYVAGHVRAGDPRDRGNLVGPMIDAGALERVQTWIRLAEAGGATVLAGGKATGPFLEPTVLENVSPDMEVCCKEVFAPLIVLQSYQKFENALAMVNDSDFGLQAGVFTRDVGRAFAAFQALEVGAVLINNVPTFRVEQMPYGGIKQSGFGREGVRYAMEDMTEIRSLILKLE
jgi:glyceraldehyde-3-phosphate dehydrogenase (NADP+)